MSLFLSTWIGLLLAPLLAYLCWWAFWRRSPMKYWWPWAATLAVIVTGMAAGFQCMSRSFNYALLLLAYFSYCCLIAVSLRIRRQSMRRLVLGIAALPVIASYGMCTIGAMALMFLVNDDVTPPETTQSMPGNVVCEVSNWGMVGISGYSVTLYQRYSALPALKRKLGEWSFTYDSQDKHQASPTCSSSFNALQAGKI